MTFETPIREKGKMNRRTFLTKSVGSTAGLTLLAFPGILTEVLEAKGNKTKKELLKELDEKVNKFMPMYRACSSTSFAALNEQFNLKADNAIHPLMPFGGGIVGKGETCGAVTGSVLAMGFYFDPAKQKGKKKAGSSIMPPVIRYVSMFCDRFAKEFSSLRCKEVVKHQFGRYYDFTKPEDQKKFVAISQKTGKCMEVIKKSVHIAAEIILDNS